MNFTPFPLSAVRVTDPYAVRARQLDARYLFSLETGRLLAGFYENAGIPTRFVRYAGWEGMLIGGHTLGHYLSALSLMYASGEEEKEECRRRICAIVDGLEECQTALGSGLIWGAIPAREGGVEAQFDNVERGKTDILKEAWVPWYTLHKLLSGLLDVCEFAEYSPALRVADRLGDWVAARAHRWDGKMQRKVLSVEYGGMNDAMYRLYALTGKPAHAAAAHKFDEETLFDGILSGEKDFLNDKHANTTIPKILGALSRYFVLHGKTSDGKKAEETRYLRVAEAFFETVVTRHTYATGGNSEWEHFGRDGVLDRERTNCNCETCNVYNMLKLAKGLFAATGNRKYADYYDNAFLNAILSSQNPETGMTTYFQPMAGGFFKVYSRPYDKFWCCTGSGMENFGKLGDGVWYAREREIVLARYLSSRLMTKDCDCLLRCDLPYRERATLTVCRGQGTFLFLIPGWARSATLTLNGARVAAEGDRFRFTAKEGDKAELEFSLGVTAEALPDAPDTVAFKYGGVLLSCGLGKENMETAETGVDVDIPKKRILPTESVYFKDAEDVLRHPEKYLLREGDRFVLHGDLPLEFGAHYMRHGERYAIYFRIREGERRAEDGAREALDAVRPGYGQYERDELHALDEKNSVGASAGATYRYARAGGYFSYDMRIVRGARNTLEIVLRQSDNGKRLKVTVGGDVLLAERLCNTMGEESYSREIEIPSDTIDRYAFEKEAGGRRETVISVRFSGFEGRASAKIYDCRMFTV